MKKKYEPPKVEKLDFDYKEAVVASTTGQGGPEVSSYNDPDGQYYKCGCAPYYAPGWGENC